MRINKSLITYIPSTGAGSGTVTSVAMTVPSGVFSILGTPITSSGTLQLGLINQLANTIWAGPTSGAEDVPTFRSLVSDDIPNLDASKIASGTLSVARGGTGATTLTGVLIGNGTSAVSGVASTTPLQLFRVDASGTGYEFFTANFMGNPFTTLGDLVYSNSAGAPVRRSPNITTTKMFLSQTGDGTSSAAPQWEAITPATIGGVPTTRTITINGTTQDLSADRTYNVGTVTSVAVSVPTGLSVSGSPITTSGTIAISLASGYSIPTTAKQTEWDAAYNDKINSAAVTGTTTKTLTLTQQDGGTITASWTDINTDAVTSVFGRTGAVVAASGDYTTAQVTESGNLYYTDARARAAISLTTTGSSGAATYSSSTGVLNIPTYTASGLGAVPTSRTITINDVVYDLSANRSWDVGDFGTW